MAHANCSGIRSTLVLLLLLTFVGCATTDESAPDDLGPVCKQHPGHMEVSWETRALGSLILELNTSLPKGTSVRIDPRAARRTVTMHVHGIDWRSLLARLAKQTECTLRETEPGVWTFSPRITPD